MSETILNSIRTDNDGPTEMVSGVTGFTAVFDYLVAGDVNTGTLISTTVDAGSFTGFTAVFDYMVAGDVNTGSLISTTVDAGSFTGFTAVFDYLVAGDVNTGSLISTTIDTGSITGDTADFIQVVAGNVAVGSITGDTADFIQMVAGNVAVGSITGDTADFIELVTNRGFVTDRLTIAPLPDSFTSTGSSNSMLMLGQVAIGGSGDKGRILAIGPNTSTFTSTGVMRDGIFCGTNVDMTAGNFQNGALATGVNLTISNTLQNGSILAGVGHVITGIINNGGVLLGANTDLTSPGTIDTGGFIAGNNHTITNQITEGGTVLGNFHTIASIVKGGSIIMGESHNLSGGNWDFGSSCVGYDHTISGVGAKNNNHIFGYLHTLDSSITSAVHLFGARIRTGDVNNSGNVYMSGGLTNLPATSDYYNASFTANTYVDNTLVDGFHIIGRPSIRIASSDTEFRDSRPLCSETDYPTTDADHLVSRSYADNNSITMLHFTPSANVGGTTNIGMGIQGTDALVRVPVSEAGTLTKITFHAFNSPGALGTQSYDATVVVNGVSSALTVNMPGGISPDQTVSATGSIAVLAEDLLSILITYNGGPTVNNRFRIAVTMEINR